jgi:hypothetical protein
MVNYSIKCKVECPICFLYYPSNINRSRCCDQPICTDCFVQLKRNGETWNSVTCPFCVEEDFGIVYYSPQVLKGKLFWVL